MTSARPHEPESEAPPAVVDPMATGPIDAGPDHTPPGQDRPVQPALRSRLPLAMRHAPFRRLTLAWVSTNIGDSALYLVLAIWVRELTGSNSAAGMVFAALGLPALLAPLAGHLADRVSRRRLMIGTNLGVAVVVLSLLGVRGSPDVWVIYAVAFCYGLSAYLTSAAQSGLLRDMLDDDELPGANGLFTTIDQGLRLISPLLGTALFVLTGPHAVVILTAGCFALTALILTTLRLTEAPMQPGLGEPGLGEPGLRTQMWAGFRVLFADPTLRLITIVLSIGVGITGFLNVLVFPILEDGLGVGSAALGIVVTVQGIGAVIGGAAAATVLKRIGERRLVGAGLAILSTGLAGSLAIITIVPLDGAYGLVAISITLATSGAGIPWLVVGASNYRIRTTPPHIQGRAAAAMNLSFNAPQTAATVAAAAIILVLDYRILMGACVLSLIGCALACRPWAADQPATVI